MYSEQLGLELVMLVSHPGKGTSLRNLDVTPVALGHMIMGKSIHNKVSYVPSHMQEPSLS